jgi:hypothetical protein
MLATLRTGAIAVSGLTRTKQLDALLVLRPGLGWPGTHAAARSLATGHPVVTAAPEQYMGVGLDLIAL